jgi:uncharacterized membrane protein
MSLLANYNVYKLYLEVIRYENVLGKSSISILLLCSLIYFRRYRYLYTISYAYVVLKPREMVSFILYRKI